MRHSPERKCERVQLRLDSETKRRLERAAAYEEKSVTEFVLAHASAAAERIIEEHRTVTLSPADWDAFYDALVHPPAPNKRLRAAVRWYRELRR
jgi:uncharacterized protein (DUF1778 family)